MKHKRLMNAFQWIPPHAKFADLPASTYTKETRKAIFWLVRDGHELFFANDSNETLEYVYAERGGFITEDEGVYSVTGDSQKYEFVRPGESVKIDEYDMYDLDFVIQYSVRVKSEGFDEIEFLSLCEKGGVTGQVILLWQTVEVSR